MTLSLRWVSKSLDSFQTFAFCRIDVRVTCCFCHPLRSDADNLPAAEGQRVGRSKKTWFLRKVPLGTPSLLCQAF